MENNQPETEKKPRRRVKKARGHGGHHGGAWKVAYADFVTAMMALFLVLWLVSQADTKVKQAIASYFRSPGVFDTMKGGILAQATKVSREPGKLTSKDDQQALYGAAQEMRKKLDSNPKFSRLKDRVKIEVTDEGLRIQLLDKADSISFPSGSAELNDEAKTILTEIAAGICDLPNKINIGGHTDNRVFQSDGGYTNWELSADRANAARRILEAGCVQPGQIHRIVGYADTDPVMTDDPSAPANRRISIVVLRLTADQDQPKSDAQNNAPGESNSGEKTNAETVKTTDRAEQNERRQIDDKLQNEGAVKIGEPDEIPGKAAKK